MYDELSEAQQMVIEHLKKVHGDEFFNEFRKPDLIKYLKMILEAHYTLLINARKTNQEINDDVKNLVDIREKDMRRWFEEREYFSREKLRKMTVGELSDILEENYKED